MANTLVTCTDTVTFHGASLLVLKIFGVPHVALKPICEALGLQWEAQFKRIKRHEVLNSTMSITDIVAADGKTREAVCLPLDKLNGWLFGVTVSRTRPEIRERLIAYQRECFDVLAGHFMPKLANCTTTHQASNGQTGIVAATPPALDPAQVADALSMGLNMANYVQRTVARAMLDNPASWSEQRWELAFLPGTPRTGPVPVMQSVPNDAFVLNWSEVADAIKARKVPREALLAIAQEATQALYVQVCNDGEKGVGAKITAQLKDMAQTDLKEVANHACMELWMRAGVSKRPEGASSDISKAGAV